MTKIPYFDAHCDTITCCEKDGRSLRANSGHLDLIRIKNTYSKAVQFFAMYHSLADAPADGMFTECKRQQSLFAKEIERNADIVVQCRNGEEIRKANAEGKIAAVLTCEGSELLNCDPNAIEWAKEVGVKAINLSHNHANFLCGTNMNETTRGLNNLGRAFVKKAQSNNILIDVSHCSDAAFWDLMEITSKPVIASHSNLRDICRSTRNITDEMFVAIVKTGGVVGLNLWQRFVTEEGDPTMDDILRHVDRFMELGGEKNLGLGADLDGCPALSGGIQGVQDLPMLWEALSKHGYDDELLEDLFYNNFLRLM